MLIQVYGRGSNPSTCSIADFSEAGTVRLPMPLLIISNVKVINITLYLRVFLLQSALQPLWVMACSTIIEYSKQEGFYRVPSLQVFKTWNAALNTIKKRTPHSPTLDTYSVGILYAFSWMQVSGMIQRKIQSLCHLGDWYIWQIFWQLQVHYNCTSCHNNCQCTVTRLQTVSTLQHPLAATQFQLLAATEGTNKMHCSVTIKKNKQEVTNKQMYKVNIFNLNEQHNHNNITSIETFK